MSEYEPISDEDSHHLINELMDVGLLAGTYVSRAAMQLGNHHPITDAFDNVAQRITVTLLEFRFALEELEDPNNLPDPDGSNTLPLPPISTYTYRDPLGGADAYMNGDLLA